MPTSSDIFYTEIFRMILEFIMKKKIAFAALLILVLAFLAGCGEKEEPRPRGKFWERHEVSDFSFAQNTDYENEIPEKGRMFCVASDREGTPIISIRRFFSDAESEASTRQPIGAYYAWDTRSWTGDIFISGVDVGSIEVRSSFDDVMDVSDEDKLSNFLDDYWAADPAYADEESIKVSQVQTKFIEGKQVHFIHMSYTADPGEGAGSVNVHVMRALYPVTMPDGSSGYVVFDVIENRYYTDDFTSDVIFDDLVGKLLFADHVS